MSSAIRSLGIDIGSVSVGVVLMNGGGRILRRLYAFHQGSVNATLAGLLAELGDDDFHYSALTTTHEVNLDGIDEHDGVLCALQAASLFCPDRRALFVVGGERFHLVRFHEDGLYRDTRSNTSCAAGTGSFLDQQAHRLGLSGAHDLAKSAESNEGQLPKIASRCSVFAKTDLIHAQQEGWAPAEICDGLAAGVARNVTETVVGSSMVPAPAYVVGGVALNPAVVRHLSKMTGTPLRVPSNAEVFGAMGAALLAIEDGSKEQEPRPRGVGALIESLKRPPRARSYCHEPLDAEQGSDATSDESSHSGRAKPSQAEQVAVERSLFIGQRAIEANPVETEVFENLSDGSFKVHFGVDIGSTSTKAVLVDEKARVLAGFYTRTAGRPVAAAQALLEAISDVAESRGCRFEVVSSATTGSGRKLVGAVFGADLILDEITAHARAATEIDPRADTIIEIGGQDAKFTTLRDGIVTFSHMNTVCAAGTGSFIEEQAAKLGVGLTEISERAGAARAPRTSDRCTVFMERDINHLLNHGYRVEEILSAVLHSVVENYLNKVATRGMIGKRVCFQGATAKNGALVAALRRKLGRDVLVSRYCHLAGALGSALTAKEEFRGRTGFAGLDAWREDIEVRTEICNLCANACKLRVAKVAGEKVAYGCLCGRDYGSRRRAHTSAKAYDGVEARRARYAREVEAWPPLPELRRDLTIGIPFALHLVDDAELWRRFFAELGLKVRVGGAMAGRDGRRHARAEFCAPMTELHGQVERLLDQTDYVFVPMMLTNERRHLEPGGPGYPPGMLCYYTQYASTAVRGAFDEPERVLSPLIGGPGGEKSTRRELVDLFEPLLGAEPREILDAYERAMRFDLGVRRSANEAFSERMSRRKGIEVVLVGRPYTILAPRMNKGIPRIISSQGVSVTVQDEIPEIDLKQAEAVIPWEMPDLPWSYATRILEVARYAASAEGLYPVFISSFRCSPDAFVIEPFRQILDEAGKPYLILQVDDLDSAVGYETRIEAGVRAFRNHHQRKACFKRRPLPKPDGDSNSRIDELFSQSRSPSRLVSMAEFGRRTGETLNSAVEAMSGPFKPIWGHLYALREKTLLVPCWDRLVCELLVDMFKARGIDARLLEETPEIIADAMRHNSGQCIPVNVIAEECIDYVKKHGLDPAKTALWTAKAKWACNIPMYASFLQRVLHSEGLGEIEVYRGMVTFADVDPTAPADAYFAYLYGGLLRRFACMIRPYEDVLGSTDRAIEEALDACRPAFYSEVSKEDALRRATEILDQVAMTATPRPKVAIFGDFYSRDNDVLNQGIEKAIEKAGGEVVTTPYSEYAKIISSTHFKRLLLHGKLGQWSALKALLSVMESIEHRYRGRLSPRYREVSAPTEAHLEDALSVFGMRIEQSGEAFENILKVLHLRRCHPDLALFVQVNPAFCCPALVTEAMSEQIERVTGIPVVSITYDGTGAGKNHVVAPYLKYAIEERRERIAG